MDIIKMHKETADNRTRHERLSELGKNYIEFKKSQDVFKALIVIKNCISLVNDVLEYSRPIKLDEYYKIYAESYLNDTQGLLRFQVDFKHYQEHELMNDLAPRHYCKDWFSTVVGVLVSSGYSLEEIENEYLDFIDGVNSQQMTIFEFVS